ncbi:MAG: TetR family transcriptional regulator [Microbacterium sp.]|uniref:TetR family transcriptional regulator n=1 Tax=Microbacterium sp. TaxID=51671 RepID=UPI003F98CEA1
MSGDITGDVPQRLVAAATEVIAAGRHTSMPLRAVAERAGTTTGAIQHHFRNKEGLLLAVLARHGESTVERLRALRTDAPPPPPVVARAILVEFLPLDEVRREEALVALAFEGLATGNADLARAYREQHSLLAELLAEHLPGTAPSDIDVLLAAVGGIRTDLLLRRITAVEALALVDHLLERFA